jgi:hypothetical protein
MATILPGYDFGVNEVPNRETLCRQARLMKITGVGIGEIDATLVGLKSGTVTGSTDATLPAVGWMWADPGGNLWVSTDHGDVPLKRAGGGFETVRWGNTFAPETPVPRPGHCYNANPNSGIAQHSEGLSLTAGGSEAMPMWDESFDDSSLGPGFRSLGWAAATVGTQASFPRLVGRGLTLMFTNGTQSHQDFMVRMFGGARVLTTTNSWVGAFVTTASNIVQSLTRESFYGLFVAPHSGTSFAVSTRIDVHDTVYGWKYDQAVFGPGAAI